MGLRHKVMVVEDTYIVSKDIQEMLHELGYSVSAVTDSGNEAVQIARKNRPDIILMDIKLSGSMDGIEAANLIHEYYNIPVVYITGHIDDRTLQRAKRTEPGGFIIKPVKQEELHTTIEMAMYKHKVENFLKGREELLASTLKSISDAVITTNEKGAVTFMNPLAETILGISQEDTLGKDFDSIFRIVEENSETDVRDPVRRVLEDLKRAEYENHILHTEYEQRIAVSVTISPVVDAKGRTGGAIITIRDVTKQRRLHEELLKVEKLESLATLADTIGHEFNNLLTVIMGNIELIKQSGSIAAEALTDINEVEIAAQKAKDLTNKLLSFAKLGSPSKKPLSLLPVLKSIVHSITTSTSIHCDLNLPMFLWQTDADETQISHVFYSIIKKAYQLSGNHGIIKVGAENRIIEESTKLPIKPGSYVRIEIREFDTSLANKQIKSVFDLRLTSEGKLSENEIELTTSYSIIKNHSGYIAVDSGANEGTIFSIYLPAKEAAVEEEAPKPIPERKSTDRRRILVMDDQQLVRIIAGKILNHFGYEVDFAQHGGEAVEKYKALIERGERYDCVILDLTVEFGMGGKDAVKKILELDPGARTIVSTGYTNDPIKNNFRAYGFRGFITKPYEFSEISKIVREVMNGEDV